MGVDRPTVSLMYVLGTDAHNSVVDMSRQVSLMLGLVEVVL